MKSWRRLTIRMPRYNYECDNCGNVITIFHSINDTCADCSTCEQKNTMRKLLSVPFVIKNDVVAQDDRQVGNITKEYIEANREILKQQKEKIKKENYEPS
jgi:putative FmdB family regulatory protein